MAHSAAAAMRAVSPRGMRIRIGQLIRINDLSNRSEQLEDSAAKARAAVSNGALAAEPPQFGRRASRAGLQGAGRQALTATCAARTAGSPARSAIVLATFQNAVIA